MGINYLFFTTGTFLFFKKKPLKMFKSLQKKLLPPQMKDSLHFSPAPSWDLSPGIRCSANFSNLRLSHEPADLHELLQCGSPSQDVIIPATNCLSAGFPHRHSLLRPQSSALA